MQLVAQRAGLLPQANCLRLTCLRQPVALRRLRNQQPARFERLECCASNALPWGQSLAKVVGPPNGVLVHRESQVQGGGLCGRERHTVSLSSGDHLMRSHRGATTFREKV